MGMRVEQIGNATLCLCDCMDLMKQYPDKHFDLAIVDPPYGINYETRIP
jgi:site-specific DNA-methyltransferase (adenine-specific)